MDSKKKWIGRIAALCLLTTSAVVPLTLQVPPSAEALTTPQLSDTFSAAHDNDPTYGLNDSLGVRQSGTARGVTYTRVSGRWDTGSVLDPSFVQVNAASYPSALSFWSNTSAVRLDAPVTADASDSLQVTATVDPDLAGRGMAGDWNSIMLTPSPTSWGYVTNSDVNVGLTIARNGTVTLYQGGTLSWTMSATRSTTAPGFVVTAAVTGASTPHPSLVVTVNNVSRTTSLAAPLALAYLNVGAYISNASASNPEVSTLSNLQVSHVSRFVDTFVGATDVAEDYGLGSNLPGRQSPLNQEGYQRVSGRWDTSSLLDPSYTQVNAPSFPSALSFWTNTSAVRLNSPLSPDSVDSYQMRASVNPDATARGIAADWNSVMFSSSSNSRGYVTNADVNVGLTVSRDGRVQLFEGGTSRWTITAPIASSHPGFDVALSVESASAAHPTLVVTVNGVERTTTLSAPLTKPYLYLGAYLTNNSARNPEVSTLTNLQISRVDEYPGLSYYGFYGVRNDPDSGNHVPDVSGFSNLSWVNIDPAGAPTDPPTYALNDLASCPLHGCILYVGAEFIDPNCSSACHNYPTLDRWHEFVRQVMPYQDRIAALYLKDEPNAYGVSAADLDAQAQAVKDSMAPTPAGVERFGPFPIMLNLTVDGPGGITSSPHIPPTIDWLGADAYQLDAAGLEHAITTMENLTPPSTRLVIFPPNVVASYTQPKYTTQQQITDAQRMYMDAAKAHPRVIGILSFGLWVLTSAQDVRQYPSQIPETFDLQERFANAVVIKK